MSCFYEQKQQNVKIAKISDLKIHLADKGSTETRQM